MSQNYYSILYFRFSHTLRNMEAEAVRFGFWGQLPCQKLSDVKNCFCYMLFYYSNAHDLYQERPWLHGFNSVPLMAFHLNCSMHMNSVSYFYEEFWSNKKANWIALQNSSWKYSFWRESCEPSYHVLYRYAKSEIQKNYLQHETNRWKIFQIWPFYLWQRYCQRGFHAISIVLKTDCVFSDT